MCLAIPYKVVEIMGNRQAAVEAAGSRRRVSLEMLPGVAVGDWVLVNLGLVVDKISEEDAKETLNIYQEITEAETDSLISEVKWGEDNHE